jgi:hypothetical protein
MTLFAIYEDSTATMPLTNALKKMTLSALAAPKRDFSKPASWSTLSEGRPLPFVPCTSC